METKIGVLSLQRAVDDHLNMIHEVGAVGIAIKRTINRYRWHHYSWR
ncbi:hypothetical protein [Cytobacillus sp.]